MKRLLVLYELENWPKVRVKIERVNCNEDQLIPGMSYECPNGSVRQYWRTSDDSVWKSADDWLAYQVKKAGLVATKTPEMYVRASK